MAREQFHERMAIVRLLGELSLHQLTISQCQRLALGEYERHMETGRTDLQAIEMCLDLFASAAVPLDALLHQLRQMQNHE